MIRAFSLLKFCLFKFNHLDGCLISALFGIDEIDSGGQLFAALITAVPAIFTDARLGINRANSLPLEVIDADCELLFHVSALEGKSHAFLEGIGISRAEKQLGSGMLVVR